MEKLVTTQAKPGIDEQIEHIRELRSQCETAVQFLEEPRHIAETEDLIELYRVIEENLVAVRLYNLTNTPGTRTCADCNAQLDVNELADIVRCPKCEIAQGIKESMTMLDGKEVTNG